MKLRGAGSFRRTTNGGYGHDTEWRGPPLLPICFLLLYFLFICLRLRARMASTTSVLAVLGTLVVASGKFAC